MSYQNNNVSQFPSELRFDPVSKDWVVIATGRAKRPESFKEKKKTKKSKSFCPFCLINGQETPTLIFVNGEKISFQSGDSIPRNWTTIVFPNKYPAFCPGKNLEQRTEGKLFQKMNAVGFHEVVVTRDHRRHLAQFTAQQIKELFDVYQERYLFLSKKEFVKHISIFQNHGREAGASIVHPHSQIITTPLVDIDINETMSNAQKFFQENQKCVYCSMNDYEKKNGVRIVFENEKFLALCPFASKTAFEVVITPKQHSPYFEQIEEKEKWLLAEAFQSVFVALDKTLDKLSYNFYLHTAPCDGQKYDYYHWRFTILPKTAIAAGFEMGARMEISTIEPEKAAVYLKKFMPCSAKK